MHTWHLLVELDNGTIQEFDTKNYLKTVHEMAEKVAEGVNYMIMEKDGTATIIRASHIIRITVTEVMPEPDSEPA